MALGYRISRYNREKQSAGLLSYVSAYLASSSPGALEGSERPKKRLYVAIGSFSCSLLRSASLRRCYSLCFSGQVHFPLRNLVRPLEYTAIRFWSFGDVTRVAIETEGDYKLFSDQVEKPPRIYFDLTGLRPPATAHHGSQTIEIKDRLVKQIRIAEVLPGKTRVVFDLEAPADVVSSQLVNPDRLMIEIRPKTQLKPTVSLARSTTGSKKIDLSVPGTDSVSGENPTGAPIVVVANSASRAPDVKQTEPSGEQVTKRG